MNRDDLRKGAYDKYFGLSRHQEQTITLQEEVLVTALLDAGISPIVDALHLKAAYIKRWYDVGNKMGVPVRVIDVPTDVEVCVIRDSKREKKVGEEVIRDLHRRFFHKGKLPKLSENIPSGAASGRAYVPNPNLPKAIWVDLDGTLAERVHDLAPKPVRGPFDEARVGEDAVIEHIAELVRMYFDAGYAVIIMSGRSTDCQTESEQWLRDNGIPYNAIFMRPSGDKRKDSTIKEELFWNKVAPHWDIRFALDDRQQVVDHTRDVLKIPVLQVAPGNF